jgi:hypothetical protein
MKSKEAYDALVELENGPGWAYIHEHMKDDIVRAAYKLSEAPNLSIEEIHFRRGAMWAARRLIELPTALRLRLENELLMEAAMRKESSSQTPPATAGN